VILKRIFFSMFPKPRTPPSWRDALPVTLFLFFFAALCIGLEWSEQMLFAKREMFLLILAAPWIAWLHLVGYSGLPRGRGMVALLIRLCMVGAFVMLMAEPRAVRTRDALSVVYAVDLSDSVGDDTTEAALNFVAGTAQQKPQNDEVGLVVFGRNASVELPPRASYLYEAINSRIARDATNLEQALSLSAAMLPEENPGRIVLITDGTSTAGSLSRVLNELKARDVSVDIWPIEYQYDREVWLERLELPRFVKIGENYEAAVVLSSLQSGEGKLTLRENGEIIYDDVVKFESGKSRYVIPIQLREPGYYEYSASIEAIGSDRQRADHLTKNNTVLNYILVEGDGKVLIVTDPAGEDRDWQTLAEAIRDGQRMVEVQDAYSFASDSLSLLPYDAIVFVNVAADAFTPLQLQAVEDAVENLGTGFLMVGGANSFGPGGYHRTPVEEALPVEMDVTKKKIVPKGALAIILHTCEFPEGNTWAKRITKQAIKVLGAKDEVGVLAQTYKGDDWIFKLTPAGEYKSLALKINGAQIGDMGTFATTMTMGLADLKASDAATKHMIVISDGDPSPPPPALLQQFIDAKVSVSMVAISPHGNSDLPMMQAVAKATGGRFYYPSDPNQLPAIFIKESKTLKRSMIQNETITPEISFSQAGMLKGISAFPQLHGYVLTTPKSRAEVHLRVPLEEEDQIDPILAVGRHGLGSSAAFTSDLSPNWGADWVGWEQYRAFVKQLMIRISRVQKAHNLRMWSYTSGSEGVIMVEDYHPDDSFLELRARVTGPREQTEIVKLKQVGPRRYRATVPLWGRGRYQVMAVPVAGDREEERAFGGFIVPYSPEYLRFRSSPSTLDEIEDKTGGVRLTRDLVTAENSDPWASAAKDIFQTRRKPKQSSRPIFDWFLITLACLVPLDVAVRRIQIDRYAIRSLFGFMRRQGPSTETMGALLHRKKSVDAGLQKTRRETVLPQSLQKPDAMAIHRPKPGAAKSSETKAPVKQPIEAETGTSTTSKLLAMKRRRRQESEDENE